MAGGWERIGIVAEGGTVLGMAEVADGQLWLATGSRLVKRGVKGWQLPTPGQPTLQPSTLAHAGGTLLVGSMLGQIAYSRDSGETWYSGHLRQPAEGVTCLAASPNFERDGVILAGTNGSGILRSTDGGRNWEMSSFGLQDFTILTLATAADWGRREVAFAGTAHGLFRSPNGGRAWKNAAIGDWVFQALAVSGALVLVGTEGQGLFRSTDGGQRWSLLDLEGETPAINALWLQPDCGERRVCLAGTSDGRIFRSEDGGEHWTCAYDGQAPILCLAQAGERLYAGLLNEGLLVSEDGGQSWSHGRDLTFRALNRLRAGANGELLAWGSMDGVWHSATGGSTWTQLGLPNGEQFVTAVAVSPVPERPCLLISRPQDLLHSEDGGQSWHAIPVDSILATAFSPAFAEDGQIWATTIAGDLLASSNGGRTWTTLPRPQPDNQLVGLDAGFRALAVMVFETIVGQITVWRSGDNGQTWSQWLQQPLQQPTALLCLARDGRHDLIALGDTCWRSTPDGWQQVLKTADSILRVQQRPDRPGILLLTPNEVLYSDDSRKWTAYDDGLAGESFVDLALPASAEAEPWAYLLTTGGELWRRRLSPP